MTSAIGSARLGRAGLDRDIRSLCWATADVAVRGGICDSIDRLLSLDQQDAGWSVPHLQSVAPPSWRLRATLFSGGPANDRPKPVSPSVNVSIGRSGGGADYLNGDSDPDAALM